MNRQHPRLEVVEIHDGGRVRVRVRGELDLATGPVLAESLRELRSRREHVLLDLDELAFIDMSGLRAVLAAARNALHDGRPLALTVGSSPVRRLLALVETDGRLPLDRSST